MIFYLGTNQYICIGLGMLPEVGININLPFKAAEHW